jgi:hypothetical protein
MGLLLLREGMRETTFAVSNTNVKATYPTKNTLSNSLKNLRSFLEVFLFSGDGIYP